MPAKKKRTVADVAQFCKRYGISEDQFYGREKIGSLYLSNLTSIPEGFNPTVGSSLDLGSVTSIPEGFNPTVGGYLYLGSLTSAKKEKVHVNKPNPGFQSSLQRQLRAFREKMTWQDGKYIKVDGIFSELISHKGNIYRTRQIGKERVEYLVTDAKGKWAHGATLEEARHDLIYKIGDRDTNKYKGLTLDSVLSLESAIEAYRIITGACAAGTKAFVESIKVKKQYTVREAIEVTKGRYGHEAFAAFFGAQAQ